MSVILPVVEIKEKKILLTLDFGFIGQLTSDPSPKENSLTGGKGHTQIPFN
jgi:hypothetical protein